MVIQGFEQPVLVSVLISVSVSKPYNVTEMYTWIATMLFITYPDILTCYTVSWHTLQKTYLWQYRSAFFFSKCATCFYDKQLAFDIYIFFPPSLHYIYVTNTDKDTNNCKTAVHKGRWTSILYKEREREREKQTDREWMKERMNQAMFSHTNGSITRHTMTH